MHQKLMKIMERIINSIKQDERAYSRFLEIKRKSIGFVIPFYPELIHYSLITNIALQLEGEEFYQRVFELFDIKKISREYNRTLQESLAELSNNFEYDSYIMFCRLIIYYNTNSITIEE